MLSLETQFSMNGDGEEDRGFLETMGGAETPLTSSRALQIASEVFGWGGGVDEADVQPIVDLAGATGNEDSFRAALTAPARSSDGRLYFPTAALERAARYYGWGTAANIDAGDRQPILDLAAASPSWVAFDNSLASPARDESGRLSFPAPQQQPQLNGYVSSLSSGSSSSVVAVRNGGTLSLLDQVAPSSSSSPVAGLLSSPLVPIAIAAGLAFLLLDD